MAKSDRGFASMNPQKQREIAAKGGREAHAQGKAHEFSHEEAVIAGRKGGEARAQDHDVRSGKLGRMGAAARWKKNNT